MARWSAVYVGDRAVERSVKVRCRPCAERHTAQRSMPWLSISAMAMSCSTWECPKPEPIRYMTDLKQVSWTLSKSCQGIRNREKRTCTVLERKEGQETSGTGAETVTLWGFRDEAWDRPL